MSKRKPNPPSPAKPPVKPAAKAVPAKPSSAAKKSSPPPKTVPKPKAHTKATSVKTGKASAAKASPVPKKAAPAPAKKKTAKAATKPKAGMKQPASKAKTPPKSASPVKKAAPVKSAAKKAAKPQVKPTSASKKPVAKPGKAPVSPPAKAKTPAAKAAPNAKAPAKAPAAKPAATTPIKATKPAKAAPSAKVPAKAAAAKPEPTPAPAVESPVEETPAPVPAAPAARFTSSVPALPPGSAANGALYYDSHMHTPLCKHAWGEPEEYAAQALQVGLKGIIFTCHCPMPDGFWPTVRMADSEFDTYIAMVERAAVAFQGRLDVRLGLESEFFPGMEGWIEKLHQRADFDYILGAVHWQARDYLAKYETGTIEAFRKTYFNHLAQSAEAGLYDCLAHPDLVKNYHPDSWCFAIVKDQIAAALDRIAGTGVAMELNTSGLNKSYSEMNPGLEMLRMMSDRGIPIVIGSDAHRPNRVGEHFMTALSHLQEAGYENVSYFLKRQRIDLKIASVLAATKKAADSQVV